LVSLAEGNSVNPVFFSGKYYYLCTIFTPGLGIDIGFVNGLFVVDDKDDDKDVYDISLVVFVFCVDDDDCFSC